MATPKQATLALADTLGAVIEGPHWYDYEECWTVDFWAPAGQRWVANREHATMDREQKLTDCWRTAINTMRQGLELCDCSDCTNGN